ncbi:hypothetical protein J6590_079452, partial [Homalodisca vitripennis]
KTLWRCDACASDAVSVSSRSDTDDPSIVELFKNIQLEMGRNRRPTVKTSWISRKLWRALRTLF